MITQNREKSNAKKKCNRLQISSQGNVLRALNSTIRQISSQGNVLRVLNITIRQIGSQGNVLRVLNSTIRQIGSQGNVLRGLLQLDKLVAREMC